MSQKINYYGIAILFLLLIGGVLISGVSGVETKNIPPSLAEKDNTKISADFFYDPSCESCQIVLSFIQQYEANSSLITVHYLNIAEDNTSSARFEEMQKNLGHVHVPFVLIGDQYLVGKDNIINKLDSLVRESNGSVLSPTAPFKEFGSGSSSSNPNQDTILFFYDPSCESCQKVLPFIQDYVKNHPNTPVEFRDISANPENYEQLEQIKTKYTLEKIYVPVVFIGKSYLQGDTNITASFASSVESYLRKSPSSADNGTLNAGTVPKPGEPATNQSPPGSSSSPGLVNDDLSGVHFFYNPTCGSCQKVLPIIQDYATNHPQAGIKLHDISGNQTNIEKFEKFRSLFPGEAIHVPVVFAGDTLLQGESNITRDFNSTVESYVKKTPPGSPASLSFSDTRASINPVVLLVAAIGEGLNPCGLLVLALLLVSLMATGTRRMVLAVGIAYICAFFLVRLLSGFALFSIIQLPGLATAFTIVAALIAIVAGGIQIKDGLSKEQKPLLSIPDSKKSLISSYMKKASIPGGFIVGVLVGIYGMACTAGIYISILGMLYKDIISGLQYLILYNIVVIIPLIAILLLVFFGLPPEKVNAWRDEKKSQLRLAIGIIMVLMGIIILIPLI